MTELNEGTLSHLPPKVAAPSYDRTRLKRGIAHFGVGNFHRAHQAFYIDRCLALSGQQDWGIVGIGLSGGERGRKKAEQFRAQNCLYSLTIAPPKGDSEVRVIGAQLDYLLAPEQPDDVLELLTDPDLRIVTLTITEGGYHVDPHSHAFVTDHPDVAHDLSGNGVPRTVFGFVTEALARRRAAGIKPFTVASCDNLRHNGEVARTAFVGFAGARDPELGAWIDANVAFPNSLVDRITPSVSAEDAARLNAASGLDDRIPLVAEDFTQWVIEGRFTDGRPAFEKVGVQLSDEVKLWEQVKVRVLNAGHLTLTYPALLLGYHEVAEAMRDPRVPVLLERFLDTVVLPLLDAPRGREPGGLQEHGARTLLQRGDARPADANRLGQRVQGAGVLHHHAPTDARTRNRPPNPRIHPCRLESRVAGQGRRREELRRDRAAPRRTRAPATGIGRSGRSAADRATSGQRCRRARGLRRQFRALSQGSCRERREGDYASGVGRDSTLTR